MGKTNTMVLRQKKSHLPWILMAFNIRTMYFSSKNLPQFKNLPLFQKNVPMIFTHGGNEKYPWGILVGCSLYPGIPSFLRFISFLISLCDSGGPPAPSGERCPGPQRQTVCCEPTCTKHQRNRCVFLPRWVCLPISFTVLFSVLT